MAKIKAFTLLEVIVALLIITFTTSIGFGVYLNILKNDKTKLELKANLLMQECMRETLKEKRYIDESIEQNGLIIKKTFHSFALDRDLHILHLEVLNKNDKIIKETNKIISTNKQ